MKNLTTIIILKYCLVFTVTSAGPIDPLQFTNATQEQRYFNLIKNLRCLKCQNSSISGSNASLAKDLRLKVYRQITQQNMSDAEIKSWMVARYGDFVLYEPPFKSTTIILWLLPILLAFMGFGLLLTRLFSANKSSALTSLQQDKLNKLLQ